MSQLPTNVRRQPVACDVNAVFADEDAPMMRHAVLLGSLLGLAGTVAAAVPSNAPPPPQTPSLR